MQSEPFEFCADCPARDKADTLKRHSSAEIRRFRCSGPLGDFAINGVVLNGEHSAIFPVCGLKTYPEDDPQSFNFGGVTLHITKRQSN